MGTRCVIAKEQSEGSVRTVSCLTDGHPAWTGYVLFHHYQDDEKIDALLDLGCLSSIGPDPLDPLPHRRFAQIVARNCERGITDDAVTRMLEEKCVVAEGAGRSMNEYDSASLTELREKLSGSDVRFIYLWGEGGWIVSARPYDNLQPLEEALAQE